MRPGAVRTGGPGDKLGDNADGALIRLLTSNKAYRTRRDAARAVGTRDFARSACSCRGSCPRQPAQTLVLDSTSGGPAAVPASLFGHSERRRICTPKWGHSAFAFWFWRSSIASIAKSLSLASTHQSVTSVKAAPSRSRRETSEPHAMRACAMAPLAQCRRQIDLGCELSCRSSRSQSTWRRSAR